MRTAILILLLVLLPAAVEAQDASTGALRGVVTDPTGARIAGAEVRLINAQTGVERSLVASHQGVFRFSTAAAGRLRAAGDFAGHGHFAAHGPARGSRR